MEQFFKNFLKCKKQKRHIDSTEEEDMEIYLTINFIFI